MHERAWNAGIGLTQYVDLWGRELTLTAEYYRTQFGRRLVPDFDSSARTLVFVADGSRTDTPAKAADSADAPDKPRR